MEVKQGGWLGDYKEKDCVAYGKGICTLRQNYDRSIRLAGDPVAKRTSGNGKCVGGSYV